ncbi:hypothetical protein GTY84_29585 [Streptomyces sp. SID8352]|nr:hypothetical protein [Streptomyces sp. SID8352]
MVGGADRARGGGGGVNGEAARGLWAVSVAVPAAGWLAHRVGAAHRARAVRGRLAGLLAPEPPRAARRRAALLEAGRAWLPLAGPVAAGHLLIGGVIGALAGAVVAGALWHWRARHPPDRTAAEAALGAEAGRQLPLAADLLAACVAAGAGPVLAARAVGEALGGPVGEALARGAAEVRLGSEPGAAWSGLAVLPGAEPLARLLERADVSGLPAAGPAARLAAQVRADRSRATTTRARRAAVMVTAPVGLCFLPAFIAVGVLPVVIGLAGGALGGSGG